MGLVVEGLTTEKIVEEVYQTPTQGTKYLQILKIEFSELRAKIEVTPVE